MAVEHEKGYMTSGLHGWIINILNHTSNAKSNITFNITCIVLSIVNIINLIIFSWPK